MSQQRRLVLFLSDVEGNLTALRQTLKGVCEGLDLPCPEVKWVESRPEALADSGWHVAEIPLVSGKMSGKVSSPEEHLDAMTQALSKDFRDRSMGMYVDREHSYARVCMAAPSRPPRAMEGEYLDVLRQAARWLDVETTGLARLFSGNAARNLLAAAVDFGPDGKPVEAPSHPAPPPEPDEDDRYVEAKLAQAKQLMDEYLNLRK
ncbi:hypothetical protein D7V77_33650 [Corallococcus sp. CA041A]|nr:hypothetical protein [Corallococcus sp. CA041A]RKH18717.1 hypothetical protein D7V77_33650 [Corallococcus sp. CA041A]